MVFSEYDGPGVQRLGGEIDIKLTNINQIIINQIRTMGMHSTWHIVDVQEIFVE